MGKVFSDETLQNVKSIQIELAKEFHSICEKHKLEYFLVAGSLLGAVRHQGFIPWDDDFDVAMLREDYEKFIVIATKELSKEYFLQTWDTDKEFGLPIAKIRKNNTLYVESNTKNVKIHKGIFIDIFPLDNKPNSKILAKKHEVLSYLYKRLILIKKGYVLWGESEKRKKVIYKILGIIVKILPAIVLINMMKNEISRYNNTATEEVVGVGGAYSYSKETIPKFLVLQKTLFQFENEKFYGFKNYDLYLKNLYGDYLTPPPKSQRENRHGIIEIKI